MQIVARNILITALTALMAGRTNAQPVPSVSYLPLAPGNTWEYVVPGLDVPPSWSGITDSVAFGDTLYYLIDLPFLTSDTLRIGEGGRVYARFGGRDRLLLDVGRAPESTYTFPWSRTETDEAFFYRVTVERDVSVEVAAGKFDGCIRFAFDVPEVADEEWGVVLAPEVGIVQAYVGLGGYRELWLARIAHRSYPPEDATIPDTLDWHGYFPLEVGNVWEYRYDSLFEPGYMRWEIVGDTVQDDRAGFVVITSGYDHALQETYHGADFWYYDEEMRSVRTSITGDCDLSLPFPVPQHEGVALAAGFCDADRLYGGYADGILVLEADTLHYPAWKWFENVAGGFTVYHGVGVPGWAAEGLTDSAHLIYARLGGVEYGASVVATSIEEPETPSNNARTASIYPNPFTDRITIETNGRITLPLRYEVVDVLGRRVLAGRIDAARTMIDARSLAAGLYFVRIADGARVLATRAVVRTAAR